MILALGATGIPLALLSALVGLKPRFENPLWWAVYLVWIGVVLVFGAEPFFTILFASLIAGVLHGSTLGVLIGAYRTNNPWHAEGMSDSDSAERKRFLVIGLGSGLLMGVIAGGLAYGMSLLI